MKASDLAGKKILVMGLGRFGGGVDVVRYAAGGPHVTVTTWHPKAATGRFIRRLDTFRHAFAWACTIRTTSRPPTWWSLILRSNRQPLPRSRPPERQSSPAGGPVLPVVSYAHRRDHGELARHHDHAIASASPSPKRPAYGNVWLSGNIGDQPLLTIVDRVGPNDVVVLSCRAPDRVASRLRPADALLTNLTPVTDRYGTFRGLRAARKVCSGTSG